jgi:alginate O-acetyltransferase complex protein AlgI
MLFHSYAFVFAFLPVTLLFFFLLGRLGRDQLAMAWLIVASLFFYGWWNVSYLSLILVSVTANYALGLRLSREGSEALKRGLLTLGVVANLATLGYFKYANFFVDNLNWTLDESIHLEKIILPLAISFFTFQQIAYLVDARRGATHEHSFLRYCLFVTFFPQFIAGPIVHHKEILPQFARLQKIRPNVRHLSIGMTIFILGLFKKVVIADSIALYSTPVFDAADHGVALSLVEAWTGALAYTFQLYFDFSGYSDMAIGLARMFGIRLPLNFNAPYKALSIIEFWRCWHMTLSRFLRDYLYIPLGGNRRGTTRRHVNLFATMLLGGLWHGAGWSFVLWGGLHGIYLVINHVWTRSRKNAERSALGRALGWLLTFLAVVVAWVPFRAETLDGALQMWGSMCGSNGILVRESGIEVLAYGAAQGYVVLTLLMTLALPTTHHYLRRYRPVLEYTSSTCYTDRFKLFTWRPTVSRALLLLIALLFALALMTRPSEFLYFQF